MQSVKTVACPSCQTLVRWEATSKWRPFCSERCRLIDLGAWASNAYKVAGSALETPLAHDDSNANA